MLSIPVSFPREPNRSADQLPTPIETATETGVGAVGGRGGLTTTGVRIEELLWKSLSKMLLLLRLAVVKLSSALSLWPGGFAAPTLTEARAATAGHSGLL
jgi:hypothetical protein